MNGSKARHEFHVEGDKGFPVVLPLYKKFQVDRTTVLRVSTGSTTDDDGYLFMHYVSEV